MSNKTCRECRYMLHKDTFEVCTHSMTETSLFDKACEHFAPPTNGDKIRQMSDEELAKLLGCTRRIANCPHLEDGYPCEKCGVEYLNAPAESEVDSKAEAAAATVEKLKEVCDE